MRARFKQRKGAKETASLLPRRRPSPRHHPLLPHRARYVRSTDTFGRGWPLCNPADGFSHARPIPTVKEAPQTATNVRPTGPPMLTAPLHRRVGAGDVTIFSPGCARFSARSKRSSRQEIDRAGALEILMAHAPAGRHFRESAAGSLGDTLFA